MVYNQIKDFENCEGMTEKDINRIVTRDTLMCDGHHFDKVKILGFIKSNKGVRSMVIQTGDLSIKPNLDNTEVFDSGELNHTRIVERN